MAREMDGMPMHPSSMAIEPWSIGDFALMFFMWAVMMVGMMLPSAAPMTLVYAAVARKASRENQVVASTGTFVGGYLAIWTLFSVGATAAQWTLDQAALLSPMLVTTSPILGALLLVVAGLFQFTPIKEVCLRNCRSPVEFMAEHWRAGAMGAFRMGAVHGAFCLGCCWALMGLLFWGGVMNLLWIAAISAFVMVEKLLPGGIVTARISGAAMIALGSLLAIRAAG